MEPGKPLILSPILTGELLGSTLIGEVQWLRGGGCSVVLRGGERPLHACREASTGKVCTEGRSP
jgi:hypothetical protein